MLMLAEEEMMALVGTHEKPGFFTALVVSGELGCRPGRTIVGMLIMWLAPPALAPGPGQAWLTARKRPAAAGPQVYTAASTSVWRSL